MQTSIPPVPATINKSLTAPVNKRMRHLARSEICLEGKPHKSASFTQGTKKPHPFLGAVHTEYIRLVSSGRSRP
ncbi:hypothetical protein RHI9324_01143 [Rhizobium sp. CECT 9324]|nr:hypothetical protein RHI9324_01143 [Rhizobium sp. CECT 9324]